MGCSGTSIRNEEAIHIMYLVCKQLTIDRQKIADNLIKTINKVISLDMTGADTNTLEDKIEAAQKKRTDLIDLYTSGDIDRDEFTALRAKYDAEIDSLKSMAESMEKQQAATTRQKERMEDIQKAVDELMAGIEYEDEFYTQLLEKMVINDSENIDVYLNLLSFKWSYTAVAASTGKHPPEASPHTERKKARTPERNISETSLPISVSIPVTSL